MSEVSNYTYVSSEHHKAVMPLSEDPNFGYKAVDEIMCCDLFKAKNIYIYDSKFICCLFYTAFSIYTMRQRKVKYSCPCA
jgi:hypothetical protein